MILATMESIIRTNDNREHSKVFLYVIQAVSSTEDESIDSGSDNWRGKIHYTHNLIKSKFEDVKSDSSELRKRMANMQIEL